MDNNDIIRKVIQNHTVEDISIDKSEETAFFNALDRLRKAESKYIIKETEEVLIHLGFTNNDLRLLHNKTKRKYGLHGVRFHKEAKSIVDDLKRELIMKLISSKNDSDRSEIKKFLHNIDCNCIWYDWQPQTVYYGGGMNLKYLLYCLDIIETGVFKKWEP